MEFFFYTVLARIFLKELNVEFLKKCGGVPLGVKMTRKVQLKDIMIEVKYKARLEEK